MAIEKLKDCKSPIIDQIYSTDPSRRKNIALSDPKIESLIRH
jgi:hypothetical protein